MEEPQTFVEAPATTDRELARKNMQWAWALFALFCVLFAGTFGVAFVYLWLS
ncbi:MAG TPA: hypothetical protein VHV52_13205 [Gaiellaceae bacterium]|jgi:hypothetical protein|nr:hypothetical protein [Gaiellaceae bacterium]